MLDEYPGSGEGWQPSEPPRRIIRVPVDWVPRDYQYPAWNYMQDGGKRLVCVWHRRAGKDDFALNWTARAALQRVGTYWHMLPKATQVKKAIWEAIDPHRLKRRIDLAFPDAICSAKRNNDMFIKFVNGSTWQAVGSDSFDTLLGSPPVGVVFSEWSLADPQAWAILRPILQENGGWAMFIYTPRGKNAGWRILQTARSSPGWFHEVLSARDTGVFTEDQLETELREYKMDYGDEQGQSLFDQEFLASFESPIMGAYYAGKLRLMEAEGRVCHLDIDRAVRVHTAWDLGRTDSTAIWFIQCVGRERRLIDYYESAGVSFDHYADVLHEKKREHKWVYGEHHFPHDIKHKMIDTPLSRIETLASLGIEVQVTPDHSVMDGINAVRRMLDRTWIDPDRCERGLECLRNYRREWDETLKIWKSSPLHDFSSHGADALRCFAVGYDDPIGFKRVSDRDRGGPFTGGGSKPSHWSS